MQFLTIPLGYQAVDPPLFVKGLSAGDVIEAAVDPGGSSPGSRTVLSWKHVAKSRNSVVWLLRMREPNTIESVLDELRRVGCNSVSVTQLGAHSVDVPEAIGMDAVDAVLAQLDPEAVAVAFPSMRHRS